MKTNAVLIAEARFSKGKLAVKAPFNTLFIKRAHELGGSWSDPVWLFPSTEAVRGQLRDLCMKLYGSDGVMTDTVTLRVEWLEDQTAAQIAIHGRVIWDQKEKLGDGVILLSGRTFMSGPKYKQKAGVEEGSVVLLQDFPRVAAEDLMKKPSDTHAFSIQQEDQAAVNGEALRAERERLLARLKQIDELLA